jgi:hypothetical protein
VSKPWPPPFRTFCANISPETIAPVTMHEQLVEIRRSIGDINGKLNTAQSALHNLDSDVREKQKELVAGTNEANGALSARITVLEDGQAMQRTYAREIGEACFDRLEALETSVANLSMSMPARDRSIGDAAESARCAVDTHDLVHKRLCALEGVKQVHTDYLQKHDDRLDKHRDEIVAVTADWRKHLDQAVNNLSERLHALEELPPSQVNSSWQNPALHALLERIQKLESFRAFVDERIAALQAPVSLQPGHVRINYAPPSPLKRSAAEPMDAKSQDVRSEYGRMSNALRSEPLDGAHPDVRELVAAARVVDLMFPPTDVLRDRGPLDASAVAQLRLRERIKRFDPQPSTGSVAVDTVLAQGDEFHRVQEHDTLTEAQAARLDEPRSLDDMQARHWLATPEEAQAASKRAYDARKNVK